MVKIDIRKLTSLKPKNPTTTQPKQTQTGKTTAAQNTAANARNAGSIQEARKQHVRAASKAEGSAAAIAPHPGRSTRPKSSNGKKEKVPGRLCLCPLLPLRPLGPPFRYQVVSARLTSLKAFPQLVLYRTTVQLGHPILSPDTVFC